MFITRTYLIDILCTILRTVCKVWRVTFFVRAIKFTKWWQNTTRTLALSHYIDIRGCGSCVCWDWITLRRLTWISFYEIMKIGLPLAYPITVPTPTLSIANFHSVHSVPYECCCEHFSPRNKSIQILWRRHFLLLHIHKFPSKLN